MGFLTLLCLTDLLLSVICSVQHAPLTYKYYGGLFTLLHYLISAMVTLYCLYSCLYFNLVMFLVFLERQKTVYRSVRKTRTISSTVIYCCSGWQKAYSSSRETREGTFKRLLLQQGAFRCPFLHNLWAKYKRLCTIRELPTWLFLSLMFAVFRNQSPLLTMLCLSPLLSFYPCFIHSK